MAVKAGGKGECFSGLAQLLDATHFEADSQMLVVWSTGKGKLNLIKDIIACFFHPFSFFV